MGIVGVVDTSNDTYLYNDNKSNADIDIYSEMQKIIKKNNSVLYNKCNKNFVNNKTTTKYKSTPIVIPSANE